MLASLWDPLGHLPADPLAMQVVWRSAVKRLCILVHPHLQQGAKDAGQHAGVLTRLTLAY